MSQREQIAEMLENEPELRKRKYRFVVAARMSGVDEETCKMICSIVDEFRHQTVADKKGLELEKEWHSQSTAKQADDWDSMFKQQFRPLA